MNILATLKVIAILWKVSKPAAERIIREAEYIRIRDMLARAGGLDQRMREAGRVEAWTGEDRSDQAGSKGQVPK